MDTDLATLRDSLTGGHSGRISQGLRALARVEAELSRLREDLDALNRERDAGWRTMVEQRDRAEAAEKELAEGPLSYPITGGYVLIDRGDLALIEAYKWSIQNDGRGKEFALATCRATGKKRSVRMHRLILDATEGQLVDHVNGNTLDNRRSNLRLATAADNQRNKDHAESESGYKGVHKKKRGGWDASLSVGGVPHRLGSYASPAEAALVRDLAALELHGEFASTNYPTEVLQRIVTAEARLDEARQECARLQQALADVREARRGIISACIAVKGKLDQPYPDDDRWTPWTRFVEPALHRLDEALAGLGSEQSSLTESGSAGLPDTPAELVTCNWCQGSGEMVKLVEGREVPGDCKACEGTGKLPSPRVFKWLGVDTPADSGDCDCGGACPECGTRAHP